MFEKDSDENVTSICVIDDDDDDGILSLFRAWQTHQTRPGSYADV